jgi:hypothetical protein
MLAGLIELLSFRQIETDKLRKEKVDNNCREAVATQTKEKGQRKAKGKGE